MKRILIVDDSIELGRTLQDALKLEHPDVPITLVPSAEEALLESTRYTFDLLVTDVRLPGMSGMDLIRKIRVRQPNIKVVMITGLALDDRLIKQRDELNPDAFMRKPISAIEFLDIVGNLFGKTAQLTPPVEAPAVPGAKTGPISTPPATLGATAIPTKPATKSDMDAAKEALLQELAGVLPGEPVEPKQAVSKRTTGHLGTGRLTSDTTPTPHPQPEDTGLSAILSRLRGTLGALSAMLLDDRGHPVAQAGDLTGVSLDDHVVSSLMGSLSAAAKMSYHLNQSAAEAVTVAPFAQAYRGADVDVVVAPVGQYVLLLASKASRSALRLAIAFEEALNAQAELATALESMGLHVQALIESGAPMSLMAELAAAEEPAEEAIPVEILETPIGHDLGLEKFEALFSQKKTGQLRLEDPDAFWETAAKVEKTEATNPGMLSFEQAQKLGLLPPE